MNRPFRLALVLLVQIGALVLIGLECRARERMGLTIAPQLVLAVAIILLGVGHLKRSGR